MEPVDKTLQTAEAAIAKALSILFAVPIQGRDVACDAVLEARIVLACWMVGQQPADRQLRY